ncbi:MAG: hypothetical protein AAAC47_19455 [Pararhizobium sp.]
MIKELSRGRVTLPRPTGFAQRIRGVLIASPGTEWSSTGLGRTLGVSEVTLRRKLASEGWTFQSLRRRAHVSSHATAAIHRPPDPAYSPGGRL